MTEAIHRIGDDGWPDGIWAGVMQGKILLYLDRDHAKRTTGHVNVRTPDGTKRGEIGDLIIRDAKGQFLLLHKPALDHAIRLHQAADIEQDEPETRYAWRGLFLITLATVAAVGFAYASYRAVDAWMAISN